MKRTRTVDPPKRRASRKVGAVAQIDKRLSEAIRQRTDAMEDIIRFSSAQDRYNRLSQEINELIGMKRQLDYNPGSIPTNPPPTSVTVVPTIVGGVPYNPGANIPPNISSVPTNPRNPTPTTPNKAVDVATEGGFQ